MKIAGPRTLVWDIDDVLNQLTREWFEHGWRPAHPDCRVAYADLKANPPHEILGAPLEEYLTSLDDFRASPRGQNLTPTPESLAWFARHGDGFRHLALTARPLVSVAPTAEWLFRHFGRWFRGFGFVPSHRAGENLPAYAATKAEWLEWLSAGDVMIDDLPANLAGCAERGLRTVLVPQPWNAARGTLAGALDSIGDLFSA